MDKQCESPHLIAANFFFAESLKLIHLSDCRSFPAACPSFADPHLVFVRQVRRQLIRVIDETPLVVCFAKLRGRCILWDFQNLRVRGEESCPCNMLVRGQQRGEQQNSCVEEHHDSGRGASTYNCLCSLSSGVSASDLPYQSRKGTPPRRMHRQLSSWLTWFTAGSILLPPDLLASVIVGLGNLQTSLCYAIPLQLQVELLN